MRGTIQPLLPTLTRLKYIYNAVRNQLKKGRHSPKEERTAEQSIAQQGRAEHRSRDSTGASSVPYPLTVRTFSQRSTQYCISNLLSLFTSCKFLCLYISLNYFSFFHSFILTLVLLFLCSFVYPSIHRIILPFIPSNRRLSYHCHL